MAQALNFLLKQYDACKTVESKTACLKAIESFMKMKGM